MILNLSYGQILDVCHYYISRRNCAHQISGRPAPWKPSPADVLKMTRIQRFLNEPLWAENCKIEKLCINHDRFKDQDKTSVFTDLCSFTAYSVIQRKALAAPQFRIFCDAAFAQSFILRVSNSVLPKLIAGIGHQKNYSFHRCTVDSFKR
jgi:hypothetical protein